MPPLTLMSSALMQAAASLHRNVTSAATSSDLPARCAVTISRMRSTGTSSPIMRPRMMPGTTTFAVMPREAISRASDLVAPCRAALAAA
jgi:hypothetical protein